MAMELNELAELTKEVYEIEEFLKFFKGHTSYRFLRICNMLSFLIDNRDPFSGKRMVRGSKKYRTLMDSLQGTYYIDFEETVELMKKYGIDSILGYTEQEAKTATGLDEKKKRIEFLKQAQTHDA